MGRNFGKLPSELVEEIVEPGSVAALF